MWKAMRQLVSFVKHNFRLNTVYYNGVSALFDQNDMTTVHLRWTDLLMPLLQKYKLNITWGDQDLLNIIFHYNPGTLSHAIRPL